jgi:Arc/MetJ-type ribon-helix-helix transcriptional regulator
MSALRAIPETAQDHGMKVHKHVMLPQELREQIRALSAETGWSESHLIRGGLQLLLEQRDRLLPCEPVSGLRRQEGQAA